MRNTLRDLNDYLFAEMERLDDEELKGDDLAQEIGRAHAIGKVAQAISANSNTVLRTVELQAKVRGAGADVDTPHMLEG